jgi:hypothetical protein
LIGNTARPAGGGASGSSLNNCTLIGNSAKGAGAVGGGAIDSTLSNCTLSNNLADYGGGGASGGSLTNCTLSRNSAAFGGGGVLGGTLHNCVLSGNGSGYGGGAYYHSLLNNCTLSGNSAGYGGGANQCMLNNCIVYYNSGPTGPDNYANTLNYCCTPEPGGLGNITNAPLFVNLPGGNFRLQTNSRCINSGNDAYVTTSTDLDGNLRIVGGVVDMGAYEFQPAIPLRVAIHADNTNVAVGYPVNFSGVFTRGRSDSWDFGDGTSITNQLFASHSWPIAGNYTVVLTGYDSNNLVGVSASVTVSVATQLVYYVNPASRNPVTPYNTWNTAATNIQDAIDVALPAPQSLVLATNGVYQTGGRVVYGALTNRIVINKPITVESVNGPEVTVIQGNPVIGESAVRCAYLTNNAVLAGFTLTAGATRSVGDANHETSGGAVWCESTNAIVSHSVLIDNLAVTYGGGAYGGTLNNCTICSNSTAFNAGSGNGGGANSSTLNDCSLFHNFAGWAGGGADSCTLSASMLVDNWADHGGGANNCTLISCSLTENAANGNGGGANSSILDNCTLIGNSSATTGGGTYLCTLNNCIVYYNIGRTAANYSGSTLNYCCTLPLPDGGAGNITAEPQLTDSAHISASSPCLGPQKA